MEVKNYAEIYRSNHGYFSHDDLKDLSEWLSKSYDGSIRIETEITPDGETLRVFKTLA